MQARQGSKPVPALFCVPFIVKDNFDTVGMAGTAGAVALLDNYPAQDAQQVSRRLSEARRLPTMIKEPSHSAGTPHMLDTRLLPHRHASTRMV